MEVHEEASPHVPLQVLLHRDSIISRASVSQLRHALERRQIDSATFSDVRAVHEILKRLADAVLLAQRHEIRVVLTLMFTSAPIVEVPRKDDEASRNVDGVLLNDFYQLTALLLVLEEAAQAGLDDEVAANDALRILSYTSVTIGHRRHEVFVLFRKFETRLDPSRSRFRGRFIGTLKHFSQFELPYRRFN